MKKLFALVTVFALVVSCFSLSASAALVDPSIPSTTVDVHYTLHGQYSISIPSSITITNGDRLEIRADYLHLIEGEKVVISIPRSSFDEETYDFPLYSSDGDSYITCSLLVGDLGASTADMFSINWDTCLDTPVHTYTPDNAYDIVEVALIPHIEPHSVAGEYTGTLQFDIALSTDSNS